MRVRVVRYTGRQLGGSKERTKMNTNTATKCTSIEVNRIVRVALYGVSPHSRYLAYLEDGRKVPFDGRNALPPELAGWTFNALMELYEGCMCQPPLDPPRSPPCMIEQLPHGILYAHFCALKGAVRLEKLGLRRSTKPSARAIACKELGLPQRTPIDKVLSALEDKTETMLLERNGTEWCVKCQNEGPDHDGEHVAEGAE